MTVNMSQGQSFLHVGVDFRMSPFTYGQLYVAVSWVTNVYDLIVLYEKDKEKALENVVYPEVLLT